MGKWIPSGYENREREDEMAGNVEMVKVLASCNVFRDSLRELGKWPPCLSLWKSATSTYVPANTSFTSSGARRLGMPCRNSEALTRVSFDVLVFATHRLRDGTPCGMGLDLDLGG